MAVMASARVFREVILIPERTLYEVSIGDLTVYDNQQCLLLLTQLRIGSVVSGPHGGLFSCKPVPRRR